MKKNSYGILYIIATPIGNLQDISQRALKILETVDRIAAEDTRHSRHLLAHYHIHTPLISLHEHNEAERTEQLISYLQKGESIALISDAGTPLISDPGAICVARVREAGIQVSPIPGCCAAIAALSASGLSTERFSFEGFLPVKKKSLEARLQALKNDSRTLIFYEAPHRILTSLKILHQVLGSDRQAVIARELTKIFETIFSGALAQLYEFVKQDKDQQRGEIILLIAGAEEESVLSENLSEKNISSHQILSILLKTLSVKQAVEITAEITGERKNALYKRAIALASRLT